MKRLIEQRYLVRSNFVALIGICLSFYFCYHLVAGQRSYLRYISLEHKIASLTEEQAALSAERKALEQKVIMMRPGSIDRDLLEERVRTVLGFSRLDEAVLLQPR